MVEIEAFPCLKVNKKRITDMQMRVLLSVERTGSQNLAAKELGISTPVLNKYLKEAERNCGMGLTSKDRRGTVLSMEGKEVVNAYKQFFERLKTAEAAIGCTPISQPLVLKAFPAVEKERTHSLIVTDDITNIFLLKSGLVGFAVFDDPIFVYENEEGYEVHDIAADRLVHVPRGRNYIRFAYGAQRIGFRYLQSQNIEHRVVGFTRDQDILVNSKCSYFMNESLAMRRGLSLKSGARPRLFEHRIMALKSPKADIKDSIIERMKAGEGR